MPRIIQKTSNKCVGCGREMTKLYRFIDGCDTPSNEGYFCENRECFAGVKVDQIAGWSRRDYRQIFRANVENLTY